MRAPWMAPGSLAMTGLWRYRALAGLVGVGQTRSGLRPSRAGQLGLVLVQAADFGLEDPHRPAQRPGRVGQLLRPEQHDDHHRDDQDLPRAVEQVTNHVCFLSAACGGGRLADGPDVPALPGQIRPEPVGAVLAQVELALPVHAVDRADGRAASVARLVRLRLAWSRLVRPG